MAERTRREFLISSGAGIAAVSPYVFGVGSALGAPSERVRHAVIGTGGMGTKHCDVFSKSENCEVVAVCDVDPANLEKAAASLPNSAKVARHADYRRVLDDPNIDTVSVATPDHWHSPVAIAAILAGKHVYVEKPCCHNIHEGNLLVQASEKHNRCVQQGTQYRGGASVRDAIASLHSGAIGKVRMAKVINSQMRGPIGREPDAEPPAGVNYDLWLGPAPKRPFSKNRFHYNWHWNWDYGTGDLGNDGIHQIDVARWGLGVGFPKSVSAIGGQLFYDDDHQTPDTQVVTYEFDNCYLLYDMRLWTNYRSDGHENGVIFYGDKGTMEIGREGCILNMIGEPPKKVGGTADLPAHVRNFLDCVRANDASKLFAPAKEAFASAALCHLGNIATRVGRRLQYDATKHQFVQDAEADKLLTREYRAGYELPKV